MLCTLHGKIKYDAVSLCYIAGMKSRLLIIALLSLTLCSCRKEYHCVCGIEGGEPYIYVISSNNHDDAIMECSPPGSDCEIAEE